MSQIFLQKILGIFLTLTKQVERSKIILSLPLLGEVKCIVGNLAVPSPQSHLHVDLSGTNTHLGELWERKPDKVNKPANVTLTCGAKVYTQGQNSDRNSIFQLHFSCWFNCLVFVEHRNNTLHRQACLCNTEVGTCHTRESNICRSCDLGGALTVAPNLLVLLEFCPPWPGVSRELSGWWTAAQTGSSPSPVLALWRRPRTDPGRPGRRRGSHLQTETKRRGCPAVGRWTVWSGENSQRVCVISRTARLLTGAEDRKVCVLRRARVKGLWWTVRRVSSRTSLNRNRPTSQTCS